MLTIYKAISILIKDKKTYIEIINNQLTQFNCDCCCNKEKLILKGRLSELLVPKGTELLRS
jgi:hypothetical protein